MKICCCSRDDELLDILTALFGAGNVLAMPDVEFLRQGSLQDDKVVIIDTKYHKLPKDVIFEFPVIVLVSVPNFPEAFSVLQLGVRGYGNRKMRTENLKQAIDNVVGGQIWLPPSIVSRLIDVVGKSENTDKTKFRDKILSALSKREKEVALFVAQGMSNQQLAEVLYVSLRTVKAHLSSIYEKTGVRNRLELGLALS